MKQKVTIVARTVEKPVEGTIKDNVSFEIDDMRTEAIVFSGKAAGICYMPDDYLSNGIQNEDTAKKRAFGNTKSGHYSVFEHSHFTFCINTTKAMAMVLNSTKLYSTSEKSGRYTSMNPETDIEKKYYAKWTDKLSNIIRESCVGYTDKEIHKLALENARYFLSVFTPTVMMFTLPFSRVVLLCEWLDDMSDTIKKIITSNIINHDMKLNFNFYSELSMEATELANEFRTSLGLLKEEPILVDHKDIGISFFDIVSVYQRKDFIKGILRFENDSDLNVKVNGNQINNDMYYFNNSYSFACLAQEQRHRTIDYKINIIFEESFYTPSILTKEEDIKEWQNDMIDMYKNSNIVPQATMLYVQESGHFENFYLKCKERVCMRAQKEIMDVTVNQILHMYYFVEDDIKNKRWSKLSPLNMAKLLSMIDRTSDNEDKVLVLPRCMWRGYKCKEPCTHVSYTCTKDRNI